MGGAACRNQLGGRGWFVGTQLGGRAGCEGLLCSNSWVGGAAWPEINMIEVVFCLCHRISCFTV